MTKNEKFRLNAYIDAEQYELFKKSAEAMKSKYNQIITITSFVDMNLKNWNESFGKAFIDDDIEMIKGYFQSFIEQFNQFSEENKEMPEQVVKKVNKLLKK